MTSRLRTLPYLLLLLPLDLIVSFLLCVSMPFCFRWRRHASPTTPKLNCHATIVIVNWDGKHLLPECLSAAVEAVHVDGGGHEILVVDNGSTDGSVQFIRDNFPTVRVLALDRNYGFTGGNNRAIDQIQSEIIILLNNDMIVDRRFLRPLLNGFSDPSV